MGDNINMKQVQQFWNMLDEMSCTNPQAYKQFIDKQLKEGLEASKKEQLIFKMTVKTALKNPLSMSIYVNIFEWGKVPTPKSDQDSVPLCSGVLKNLPNKTGKMISIAFNPQLFTKHLTDPNSHLKNTIIQLALDCIEKENNVVICRDYTLHNECGGSKEEAIESIMERFHKKKPTQPASDLFEDILNNAKLKESSTQEDELTENNLVIETKQKKKKSKIIIEEIQNMETSEIKTPVHQLHTLAGDQLGMRVWLPGVQCVDVCALEVSEEDILLEADNQYFFHFELPARVRCENVMATFNPDTQCLSILMQKCVES